MQPERAQEELQSKYQLFDRSKLKIRPITERRHEVTVDDLLALEDEPPEFRNDDLAKVTDRLEAARKNGRARVLMLGAEVMRSGVNSHVIDLIEQGYVTHVALNGGGAIHDYELARVGATAEMLDLHLRSGELGLWSEIGEINQTVLEAQRHRLGLGESLGRSISRSTFPYRQLSVLAAAYRRSIPATVHVGIGCDIAHEHPNCDGAAYGEASYRDFLILARSLESLAGGVTVNIGAPIMGPEVYMKALSMVRNVAHQHGRKVNNFTTAIFDVWPIRGDFRKPLDEDEENYFQPHRTVLVRTVADGGEAFYLEGQHRATVPALRRQLLGL